MYFPPHTLTQLFRGREFPRHFKNYSLEDHVSRVYFILSAFATAIGRRPPRSLNGVLPAQRWGSGGVYLAISGYVGASMLQAIFIPLMFDLASELRYAVMSKINPFVMYIRNSQGIAICIYIPVECSRYS